MGKEKSHIPVMHHVCCCHWFDSKGSGAGEPWLGYLLVLFKKIGWVLDHQFSYQISLDAPGLALPRLLPDISPCLAVIVFWPPVF
ncbi:hypothetical protein Pyn_15002 [Prunus yedoensis var. nudiflora]|uniref:Uncharacterized protein n=1 Tax=Prunus yedoensis var. nudiflora TaxID=2094558 RepID=A0A314XS91_PRUYE|nr:hypothetical protein Pyn_15002 [Prunus yedoensis var. nudiflora]